MEWFKQAQYGLMIHWGIYTMAAGEWKEDRIDLNTPRAASGGFQVGEWLQRTFTIPIREYEKLAAAFCPVFFDAREWAKAAKDWGMRYIVITAKHHDGFAMFDSQVDEYNVVRKTPFGRDIIGEFSQACKEYGLKFGVYYSQALDWHEKNGGDYWPLKTPGFRQANLWDFPDSVEKDYREYFDRKVKGQIEELLTRYDNIDMIWFDGADRAIPRECSEELYHFVKKLKPECLVNTRVGHGFGDVKSFDDNEFPDGSYVEGLYETPATLNGNWGYVAHDQRWKSPEEVLRLKEHLNSRGVNYLLNVGPDPIGRIPAPAKNILDAVAKKL